MCVSYVFFFFFKQKTAYEIRIRDWSSDVCSSDLCLSGYPPLFLRARAEGAEAWLFLYHKKPGEYHALANWYSFTFSPIFSANSEERTRLALLRAIARRLRGRATHISLRPVDRKSTRLNSSH